MEIISVTICPERNPTCDGLRIALTHWASQNSSLAACYPNFHQRMQFAGQQNHARAQARGVSNSYNSLAESTGGRIDSNPESLDVAQGANADDVEEKLISLNMQLKVEVELLDQQDFLILLRECGTAGALAEGKRIHTLIVKSGYGRQRFLGNLLVEMYGKCHALEFARMVFDAIPEKNSHSWTIMITACAHNGSEREALLRYRQMRLNSVKPNKFTFATLLHLCSVLVKVSEGKMVHACTMQNGAATDVVIGNALISMYGNFGSFEAACIVFNGWIQRDVVSWNAIITACTENCNNNRSLFFLRQMQLEGLSPNEVTYVSILNSCTAIGSIAEGKFTHASIVHSHLGSDLFVGNALLNLYSKCGSRGDAQMVIGSLSKKDIVSWNSIIAMYSQEGNSKEAIDVFEQMQEEGSKPNSITFINLLEGGTVSSSLIRSIWLESYVLHHNLEIHTLVGTSLVNVYGKHGYLCDSYRAFCRVQLPTLVTYNAMLAVFSQHGQGGMALQIFNEMQLLGMKADGATLASVFCACSHCMRVDEGCHQFISAKPSYGIFLVDEHYHCIVDLLARVGLLDEAEDFIIQVPLETGAEALVSFLRACGTYASLNKGENIGTVLFT